MSACIQAPVVELLAAGIEYVHFWLTLVTVLGLSVLRLLTKVVSLIVKNCSSSSVSVAIYVQSFSAIVPLALSGYSKLKRISYSYNYIIGK